MSNNNNNGKIEAGKIVAYYNSECKINVIFTNDKLMIITTPNGGVKTYTNCVILTEEYMISQGYTVVDVKVVI